MRNRFILAILMTILAVGYFIQDGNWAEFLDGTSRVLSWLVFIAAVGTWINLLIKALRKNAV